MPSLFFYFSICLVIHAVRLSPSAFAFAVQSAFLSFGIFNSTLAYVFSLYSLMYAF